MGLHFRIGSAVMPVAADRSHAGWPIWCSSAVARSRNLGSVTRLVSSARKSRHTRSRRDSRRARRTSYRQEVRRPPRVQGGRARPECTMPRDDASVMPTSAALAVGQASRPHATLIVCQDPALTHVLRLRPGSIAKDGPWRWLRSRRSRFAKRLVPPTPEPTNFTDFISGHFFTCFFTVLSG